MMNKRGSVLFALLLFVSCGFSGFSPVHQEYLKVRRTSYRVIDNKSVVQISFEDNVWYQDSMGITQLTGLGVGDTPTRDSIYTVPLGYRFVDMRKKWAYEYRNLSDTAAIIEKHKKADSIEQSGGWNFFRKAVIQFDSLQESGDTVINGRPLKNLRYIQHFNGRKFLQSSFADCNRKGTIFLMDVGLSNAAGCPIVKGITMTPDRKFPLSSVEIEYISNVIPDSVKRIFAVWKKKAELNPPQ